MLNCSLKLGVFIRKQTFNQDTRVMRVLDTKTNTLKRKF